MRYWVKGICRNGVSLCGTPVETDLGKGRHRIMAVAPARNTGSYVLGSIISF